jgi:ribosomal protein L11 methyltransferase
MWELGTLGIIDEAGTLRVFFTERQTAADLLICHASIAYNLRVEPDTPWLPDSAVQNESIALGQRFLLTDKAGFSGGRHHLVIDTSIAFGTGRHESTQLMLERLETTLQPSQTVLDIGCGSGILSQAAALLGAARVFSCDIHPQAVSTTRQHVKTPVFLGSADAIADATADLILANITGAILDHLAADLQRIAKPGATLILSGFLEENAPRCFLPVALFEKNDWLCWLVRPEHISPRPADTDPNIHPDEWWF